MNVLLSAYACAPGKGSEPQIGWNWARAISEQHQTWVLTRRKHQAAIEGSLAKRSMPNTHFVYVDLPRWARAWKDLPGGVYLYYLVWQILAYRRAVKLAREVDFGVVHHVTFCMFWMPTLLPQLGIPFVWGPLGGGESAPRALCRDLPLRARLFEWLRGVGQLTALANPLVRMVARRSVLALAGTPETASWLKRLGCREVELIPVVGVTSDELAEFALPQESHGPVLRVFSAGRLLHWKGYHLALRALAALGDVEFEYCIFGDGPERTRLQRLAKHLGIEQNVVFKRGVSRTDLLEQMPGFAVLLHPSFHDSGGFACLEAMASGCPIICLDLGGPAMQVNDDTGVKISAHSSPQVVHDITQALRGIAADPGMHRRMAAAGPRHVKRDLSLDRYMEKLSQVYPVPQPVGKSR